MADTFGIHANIGNLKTLLENLQELGVTDTSNLRITSEFHGQYHIYVDYQEFGVCDAETFAVTPFEQTTSGS